MTCLSFINRLADRSGTRGITLFSMCSHVLLIILLEHNAPSCIVPYFATLYPSELRLRTDVHSWPSLDRPKLGHEIF